MVNPPSHPASSMRWTPCSSNELSRASGWRACTLKPSGAANVKHKGTLWLSFFVSRTLATTNRFAGSQEEYSLHWDTFMKEKHCGMSILRRIPCPEFTEINSVEKRGRSWETTHYVCRTQMVVISRAYQSDEVHSCSYCSPPRRCVHSLFHIFRILSALDLWRRSLFVFRKTKGACSLSKYCTARLFGLRDLHDHRH